MLAIASGDPVFEVRVTQMSNGFTVRIEWGNHATTGPGYSSRSYVFLTAEDAADCVKHALLRGDGLYESAAAERDAVKEANSCSQSTEVPGGC